MTKHEIIARVAQGTGLTKIETEAVINGFIAVLRTGLKDGERIEVRGLGVFSVRHRASRTARNPRTNELINVDAHYVPVFKAARELRNVVDASRKAETPPSEDPSPE